MDLLEKDKRKFNVIIGSKKCGLCSGASPSGAARKVKGKRSKFYLKETTKGSKKKLYGPYSSKKLVVQLGGLRFELCKNLIDFFLICPSFMDKKIDDGYKSIENAFRLLGISNIDPDRYTKLKYLIFLRTQDEPIPFCELLCSEDPNLSEDQSFNEVRFIVNSRDGINMQTLSPINWINFIRHFKLQLKNMEIRNQVCMDVLNVLNNCDKESHPAHFKDLLPNVYKKFAISSKQDNCNILKGIFKLREEFKFTSGHTPSLLDVLFNITENLMTESVFIDKKHNEIISLLGCSSITKHQLTIMWHNVIKFIRELINSIVEERKEGIKVREQISEQQLQIMLKNLEEAKAKERNNKNFFNKMKIELEKAKALFAINNLKELNSGNSGLPPSFLLSSQKNNGRTPQTFLMSTINNKINRGFARGGPAEEPNSNEPKNPQSYLLNNSELAELGINPNGSSAANPPTNISKIPRSMLQPVGRPRRNVKPTQPPHNNKPEPKISNLERRLAALKND